MTQELRGWIVMSGGEPTQMEMSDDIQAGTDIEDPTPIFSSAEDAEKAFKSNAYRYGNQAKGKLVPVVMTIHLDAAVEVELSDQEEEDE